MDPTASEPEGRTPPARRSRLLRVAARVVLYPWGLWSLCAWLPRRVRGAGFGTGMLRRWVALALHVPLALIVFLPGSVYVSGELLIAGNEWLIGEQADYGLQSDHQAALPATDEIELPGPQAALPAPVEPGANETYRRYLTQRFAPVIVQKVAHHPEWDIPVAIDFDGTLDPRDNVVNEPRSRPHVAAVYGELTAETEDSYYLTYSLYHVKDYDHPLRELITDWTYHDSDNEGFHIRVDKRTLEVVSAETWFHNRFLLFNRSGISTGTEPVHGQLQFEAGRLLIYAQPQGHGVRCLQRVDLDALDTNVKILRPRGDRELVRVRADRATQTDATYEIVSFDPWYAAAQGPFGKEGKGESLFEDFIHLGSRPDGRPLRLGRYIAGRDYSKNGWSRPKPPWSWDDGWDRIPIFVWHFLPSYSFESHGGEKLSHTYLYNRPFEKTFGDLQPEEMWGRYQLEMAQRQGDKWASLEDRGGQMPRETYWRVFSVMLKGYVNYLFHALG